MEWFYRKIERKEFIMIQASNITLRLGKRALFEDVNIKFTEGNCYGLIGANGAGKSTFLKILNGQLEPTQGEIIITPGQRLSFLQQDHFKYDQFPILDTVIMGNQRLYDIMKEKDAIYAKEDFTEEDGIKASELEGEFATMNGWEAESDAATLLNGLGIETELHTRLMSELNGSQKVKVLLAQALFGNPDILLLDEPTNHLDMDAIRWLEEFLIDFENTVIVVSHDRYFLNKVCTHTADIDYGKIQLYAGNYDFWYESSQLMIRQMKEANKKKEEKIKELQEFIQRFSANASKSKQATSRKRALEKIQLEDIRPSSRKYPYIDFRPAREIGNEVLTVNHLSKTIDGVKVLDDISFIINREDKVAFVGPNTQAITTLFRILAGEIEPDAGDYKWGVTTTTAYFPKDNTKDFSGDEQIVDWLMQYSPEKDVTYVRGFLGRMLFAGEEGVKKVKVLSGGEKVRVMLSKMMIMGANVLLLDEPTNHLDMESITALNNGLMKFSGVALFTSQDHQFIQTIANRIMELTPNGLIDKISTYDEYLDSDEMARKRQIMNFVAEEEPSDEEDV
jgi:ATPase subunit of ABC transporter with duplicated ATPase domains